LKAKTEELLYLLLWACDVIARPTFRNLSDSFEGWVYRNGFRHQLAVLERQKLLECERLRDGQCLHRLTEGGRKLALGNRDPVARWNRRWDGKWRMVLYDVPQTRSSDRTRLRRSLADRGFGFLQNSVWITPDPLIEEREALTFAPVDVESLILLETRPCAGETDAQIVVGAWNFDAINAAYDRYGRVLDRLPAKPLRNEKEAQRLQRWCRDERLAWNAVLSLDPLLPERLHPDNYCGRSFWERRLQVLSEVGRRIRNLHFPLG
jgi:phenylacetic acid degradation operon negative regulatory protein